jgi:hypothetical protein
VARRHRAVPVLTGLARGLASIDRELALEMARLGIIVWADPDTGSTPADGTALFQIFAELDDAAAGEEFDRVIARTRDPTRLIS